LLGERGELHPFVTLPVTFLSTTFMPPGLIPGWVRSVARSIRWTGPSKLGGRRRVGARTGRSCWRESVCWRRYYSRARRWRRWRFARTSDRS